jgi:uncharacterized protein
MDGKKGRFTRRQFLTTSAALGAGALLPGSLAAEEAAKAVKAAMPTKILGKTGERVTALGFGSALHVTPPLLNIALAEGITFIDTAQGYENGNSEKNIGAILERNGRRKDCFIVTKSGDHSVEKFVSSLENDSLPRLRTDYVDLYYLHNLGTPDRLDDEMKQTAERLKREKKIRFFGFSSHHDDMVPTLNKAAEVGFVDVIMFKYNFRDYDDAELNKAMDKCAKAGIGLVAMKTQGGAVSFQNRVDPFAAKGFNKHQACLKAVWADDRIHCIVSAMKNLSQLKENTEAARRPSMGLLERQLLDEYAAETSHLYCRGCAHNCEGCVSAPLQIADTLRYRMYSENYGDRETARRLFSELPARARAIAGVDFSAAETACPHNLPIGALMQDAAAKLA